jgi:hypothetical protein
VWRGVGEAARGGDGMAGSLFLGPHLPSHGGGHRGGEGRAGGWLGGGRVWGSWEMGGAQGAHLKSTAFSRVQHQESAQDALTVCGHVERDPVLPSEHALPQLLQDRTGILGEGTPVSPPIILTYLHPTKVREAPNPNPSEVGKTCPPASVYHL